jgi:hypothetical protein
MLMSINGLPTRSRENCRLGETFYEHFSTHPFAPVIRPTTEFALLVSDTAIFHTSENEAALLHPQMPPL